MLTSLPSRRREPLWQTFPLPSAAPALALGGVPAGRARSWAVTPRPQVLEEGGGWGDRVGEAGGAQGPRRRVRPAPPCLPSPVSAVGNQRRCVLGARAGGCTGRAAAGRSREGVQLPFLRPREQRLASGDWAAALPSSRPADPLGDRGPRARGRGAQAGVGVRRPAWGQSGSREPCAIRSGGRGVRRGPLLGAEAESAGGGWRWEEVAPREAWPRRV